ncbi:MAG: hypothetical protein HYX69_14065 [Planctomycetia bacterium]|nr:hypothetical protein [Planctomycetia bacterium]
MSETTHARPITSPAGSSPVASGSGTRVDPAHVLGTASAVDAAPAALPPARGGADAQDRALAADLLPRVRLQGRQLARLLARRQQDLDRREGQQQAQAADLENAWRAARLWLVERERELGERASELDRRDRELSDRASRLSAAEAYHEAARQEADAEMRRREDEVARRHADVERAIARLAQQTSAHQAAQRECEARREREHESLVHERQQIDNHRETSVATIRLALAGLERRRAAIEEHAAAVARRRAELIEISRLPSADQKRFARELEEIAGRLSAREEHLKEAEAWQIRAEAELVELRRQIDLERERTADEARAARQRLVEQDRAQAADAARQQEALARQRVQIDERQVALERLRAELAAVHREALEARVAAEETLANLSGTVPSATLVRSLAESRKRLADHWRLAAARIVEERAALVAMRDELAGQTPKLRARKAELEQWVEHRRREFDEEAAALAVRAEELRKRESEVRAERATWDRERLDFERQLRGVAARLRESGE